uniref:Uncharacterized protein MANES_15G130300 n=1 Tax=Rhizophora mucronata TaxID=61149 RepID=A0A2P2QA31_RHIMU
MTLSGKLEGDVEIKAPAALFHDVLSCRPHHLNNMAPDKIHGCELHKGEWGKVGTVICWDYTHDGVKKVAKDVIEAIDDQKLSTTFKLVEGDLLKEYKDFKIIVQATPKPDGQGSLVHWTLEYEKLDPNDPDPTSLLEFCINTSKDIEAHLTQAQA